MKYGATEVNHRKPLPALDRGGTTRGSSMDDDRKYLVTLLTYISVFFCVALVGSAFFISVYALLLGVCIGFLVSLCLCLLLVRSGKGVQLKPVHQPRNGRMHMGFYAITGILGVGAARLTELVLPGHWGDVVNVSLAVCASIVPGFVAYTIWAYQHNDSSAIVHEESVRGE